MRKFLVGLAILAAILIAINFTVIGSAEANLVQWETTAGGNGHWYELVTVPMSFPDAVINATTKGGYLATPNLEGEASFIATSLIAPAGGTFYWLGVYAVNQSQPWMWITGGIVTS